MHFLRTSTWFAYSLRAVAAVSVIVGLPLTTIASWPGSAERAVSAGSGPGVINHPINVVPSNAIVIPADWPLAANGTITCLTCHTTLPRDNDDRPQLRGASGSTVDARQFCIQCHHGEARPTAANMHWVAVNRAHIGSDNDADVPRNGRGDGSRQCLACHDGVSAPDTGYETNSAPHGGDFGDPRRNHPIGVRYPWGGKRGGDSPLRPAALLPKSVRLPSGNVDCVSCHNMYANSPKLLSVPIEGSALCFTCHDMN